MRRLALRRKERKRRTEIAPVRRRLAAIWMKEGSSVEERREGVESYGISMGPSVSDDDVEREGMAEIEKEEVGFVVWRKGRREGLKRWLWLCVSKSGMGRWWHLDCNIVLWI